MSAATHNAPKKALAPLAPLPLLLVFVGLIQHPANVGEFLIGQTD